MIDLDRCPDSGDAEPADISVPPIELAAPVSGEPAGPGEPVECSIEKTLDILGGKWTFLIIRDLICGTRRFGELRKSLVGISPKTLTTRLKELEEKAVVCRTAYATIPPTVEYNLTEKGRSLIPIIKAMKLWGARWG